MITQKKIVELAHLREYGELSVNKKELLAEKHRLDKFFAKFNRLYDISIETDEKIKTAYHSNFKKYADINSKIKTISYYLKGNE